MYRSILASLAVITTLHAAPPVFDESKGLIVIEAESTTSSLKKWIKKTDVDGFTGDCHLEFTGNKPESGPAHSPLKYIFKVNKAGNYGFAIRARKRLISERQDICNDCYVRLDGDYTSGNGTPISILKKDTKMYGGIANGWGYTSKLDADHKKHTPLYNLKAGETYTLVISGRSQNFNIDRFLFVHEDSNLRKAQSSLPKECKTVSTTNSRIKPAPAPKKIATMPTAKPKITGEGKRWHRISFTFDGPDTSEKAKPNPFTDYRMDVKFTHAKTSMIVPGYFAADGDAANSSADSGNKWRVHFSPPYTGKWQWKVSFRKGAHVATADKLSAGESAGYFDLASGIFTIAPSDKKSPDLRALGRLDYVGKRYPRTIGNGKIFFKVGADAPENFLAYKDFDGDFKSDGEKDKLVKTWQPHVRDWRNGDPTWSDGKGKGIVGAVNYLASKGMNAVSFLTMNIGGDDRNVFPYIDYKTYDRLDVSRLAQWEIVFEHASNKGIFLHFKTQETENETLLDNGDTGSERRLYYRELIARFAHHPALNWNMGEENGGWAKKQKRQSTKQRLAMGHYIKANDPYHHPIVIHNGQWFTDLYGVDSPYCGASLQTNKADFAQVHPKTQQVIRESKVAGKTWMVACDEPGDASHSLIPDAEDSEHNAARMNALWGNLLAGGWGVEWYFGYKHDHSDLTCQDYRSRDIMWDQSRHALHFFRSTKLPYDDMGNHNGLLKGAEGYCLAKPGHSYIVLLKKASAPAQIDLPQGSYQVQWYNPRTGGSMIKGNTLKGGSLQTIGTPPTEKDKDWVALITKG